ncbi:AMP-binding protein [Pseudomaricurvus alcaniphilus]|uniref:AMP-binding protein n=1 Tax=Pseudomaricurvus alcaniphilus TaxID=1166482 RepID=UPI001407605F|nr:AMP-binding protein [Pseudomaricurvus alcaniphilus]NHN36697.1 AMP-binding protein [Pseudomaricurvus alcaniphilus]
MSGALYQLFSVWLESCPERSWLKHQALEFSYSSISAQVNQLTGQLEASGLRPGDRVAIYMAKSPGLVVALLACSRMNLVAVPVHMVLKGPQLNYILSNSSAAALIIDERRRDYVTSVLSADALSWLVCYREEDDSSGFYCEARQSVDATEPLPARFAEAELLIYTSGSTGSPKGVVVSRSNIKQGAQSVSEYLGLDSDDRVLSLLPLAFDYGFNQLSSSLYSGAALVLMDYLLAADVVRQVQQHKITVIAAVPPLWIKLLGANWKDGAGASVRLLTNSGGRLPAMVQKSLLAVFNQADLVLMYGLTEAFRSTYLPADLREQCPDSIGDAIPGAELYIINERGEQAATGEAGELVHCGPLVTLGYWGDSQMSELRFRSPPVQPALQSESGKAVWSGDQVYRGDNGLIYFIGREDGLIKSSGYRISPEDLEEVAYSLQGVNEVVALGIDDFALGQRLVMVIGTSVAELTAEMVIRHMRSILPEYMVPHQIEFWQDLPRTPSGKFDRVAIKDQLT